MKWLLAAYAAVLVSVGLYYWRLVRLRRVLQAEAKTFSRARE